MMKRKEYTVGNDKKRRILMTVCIGMILLCLGVSLCGCGLAHLSKEDTLRHYFDDWTPEVEASVIPFMYEFSFNTGVKKISTEDIESLLDGGRVLEIYCIMNERVYFGAQYGDEVHPCIWCIASVDLEGENLIKYYEGDLTKKDTGYHALSYFATSNAWSWYTEYGGWYSDGKIYLHGKEENIMFDITTEAVQTVTELPTIKYQFTETSSREWVVEDVLTHEKKVLTPESMAETNEYAKQLTDMDGRPINTGDSPLECFFACFQVLDEQIYVITQVYNWWGSAYAIVFQFDFDSEQVLYVRTEKIGDPVADNYRLISVIS